MKALVIALLLPATAASTPSPEKALREFSDYCDATKKLWGTGVCGPLLIVDRATRAVTANRADPAGRLVKSGAAWTGTLPAGVPVANTAVDWDGVRWTMLLHPLPAEADSRRILMLHEGFHRIQPALGLTSKETDNGHLDRAVGRTWLRLEMRALGTALAGGRSWRTAARDALAFRAERRRLGGPATGPAEDALERNEGLAEYTGLAAGLGNAAAARAMRKLEAADTAPSFVRNFAYATGPAYGLLLDRAAGTGWRTKVRSGASLGDLLAAAVGAPSPLARAENYDRAVVERQEDDRATALATRDRDYRMRLVDGPVVRIAFVKMNIEFNPNQVFSLEGQGSVYPEMNVRDAWGTLTVTRDGLLASDWSNVRLAGPATLSGNRLSGPGWTLDLTPGWTVAGNGREQSLSPPAAGAK